MTVMDPVIYYLLTCEKKRVTLHEVMEQAERPRRPVLAVLDKLTCEGYLLKVKEKLIPAAGGLHGRPRRNSTWKIVGDLSNRPKTTPRRNTMRDKLWKLIRAKRYFTSRELEVSSGAGNRTVTMYLNILNKSGYIRRTGKDGKFFTYMLVKDQVKRPIDIDKR